MSLGFKRLKDLCIFTFRTRLVHIILVFPEGLQGLSDKDGDYRTCGLSVVKHLGSSAVCDTLYGAVAW